MWYIYAMKYDSAIQIKEIVKFAGKWIILKKKNHPKSGNSDPGRQIWYVFTYM